MTERPDDKRRDAELREREEEPGRHRPRPPDHETEERLIETERRKEQLQEAWRRRRTPPPAPRVNRPNDRGR